MDEAKLLAVSPEAGAMHRRPQDAAADAYVRALLPRRCSERPVMRRQRQSIAAPQSLASDGKQEFDDRFEAVRALEELASRQHWKPGLYGVDPA
ncbi:hypothetical protein [Streptomyces cavernicola]|uniref:Uncharacterized protein n=1 Tax=Streptomyces cavernicola TaxID=3043613 RepID=A0ABT6SMF7_9ACTN|nr:hypothetical protein [Streptomyces sp. B-S-A6]MDI3409029.1 hypothetical protein [Streptomyces sp. B-S-A6]